MVKRLNMLLKIVLIIGIIFSISGCGKKENSVDASTKVVTKNNLLEVTSPVPFAEIPNPVTVKGKSNFFEATTRIRIIDSDGRILADTSALAEGWGDKLYPFSKEVSYKNTKNKNGYVEVFEESPKDGDEIFKVKIPVTFKINK